MKLKEEKDNLFFLHCLHVGIWELEKPANGETILSLREDGVVSYMYFKEFYRFPRCKEKLEQTSLRFLLLDC